MIAGPQKKSRMISDKEKKIIAYHEAGHTLIAKLIPGSDPVHKVSIIPRGPALGYTLQLPLEDRFLTSKNEIISKLSVLLAGRVSEEIIFDEVTTGAQNDLAKATEMAHKMVTEFGMSDKVGPLSLQKPNEEVFLGRDYTREPRFSDKTSEVIDEEVKRIVEEAKENTERLLRKNIEKLKELADKLIEKEILNGEEIENVIGDKTDNNNSGDSVEKTKNKTARKGKTGKNG